ncbi:MAG: DUF4381 family protein, partial [Planctomycetota bacterium]
MNTDPYSLDRLVDVIEPEPVAWWPPAVGWVLLILVAGIWLSAGALLAV